MRLKELYFLTGIALIFVFGCKKTPDPIKGPENETRADLTRDSIYKYAKQIYLWSDALPTEATFNVKRFTTKSTDFLNYEQELIALTQYKINTGTGLPYEYYRYASGGAEITDSKYSYISDITNKNPTAFIPNKKSAVDLEGNGNDFGVKLGVYLQGEETNGKQEFVLYVTAVYQNSPADKAGIVRSHKILKINDKKLGDDYKSEIAGINSAFSADKIALEGVTYVNGKADAPFTINLDKAVYKSSPVYTSKVFTVGAKKIGYLAYARFSTLTNSKPDFDIAFEKFAAANVTDLIVDLRYNGGGYVNTAQYLIDQIAPSSLSSARNVMYSEYYNPLMQSGGATILKNQPLLDASGKVQKQGERIINYYEDIDYSVVTNTEVFQKKGPLTGVTKVVFIVSGNTASASELVINSLKPYITVKMVGRKTYGKPVGFFPIRIENKYDVYYSLFQTRNSEGKGDYFNGFVPDVPFTDISRNDLDDPRNNFGDPEEYYTSVALKEFGAVGPVTTSFNKTMSINGKNVSIQNLKPMRPIVDGNEFVGMIETRHRLKK